MTGSKGVDVAAQSRLDDSGSDADLRLRACDGDPAAWDEILRLYGPLVSATVRSFGLQEADALDAVQIIWLRLVEYTAERMQFPKSLPRWLVHTARRECPHILRQAKHVRGIIDVEPDTVTDPSVGSEQRIIDDETKRTLWKLVDELPQRRLTLLRALLADNPCSYAEIARATRIPLGGVGPTRARALRQLRDKLNEHELGSEADVAKDVEGEPIEGDRTGSYVLDDLLDKAEQVLREKLEPAVTDLRTAGSSQGTVDAQLYDLLHRADAALCVALRDHGTNVSGFLPHRKASLGIGRAHQLTIAELAARTGISVRTIRFYVGMGLIPPPEVRGRLGLYDDRHVARLELVRDLRGLGFTLSAIEGYLARIPVGCTLEDLALHRALLAPWLPEDPEPIDRAELDTRLKLLDPAPGQPPRE